MGVWFIVLSIDFGGQEVGPCAVQLCAKARKKSVTSIFTTVKMRGTIKASIKAKGAALLSLGYLVVLRK